MSISSIKFRQAGTLKRMNVEHRTTNIERPIMKISGIPKGLKGVGYTVEDLEDLTEGAYHRGAQSIMPSAN